MITQGAKIKRNVVRSKWSGVEFEVQTVGERYKLWPVYHGVRTSDNPVEVRTEAELNLRFEKVEA